MPPKGETITSIQSVEYAVEKMPRSHIPAAEIYYENGIPKSLRTETKEYDVRTSQEKMSARKFFAHTTEYGNEMEFVNDDGTVSNVRPVKSITFENAAAQDYFMRIYRRYRKDTIKQDIETISTLQQLDHFTQPGNYGKLSLTNKTDESNRAVLERRLREGKNIEGPITLGDRISEQVKFTTHGDKFVYTPAGTHIQGLKVTFSEDDYLSDLTGEVVHWIENMQEDEVPITVQKTQVATGKTPITIHRVIIGNLAVKPEQQFLVEERIAEKVLFAKEVLKFSLQNEITVYDNVHLDEKIDNNFYPSSTGSSVMAKSKAATFMHTSASHIEGTMLLNETARKDPEKDNSYVLRKSSIPGSVDHEAAHFIDINASRATRPQKEGFADSVENGFVFSKAVRELHHTSDYSEEVTYEHLLEILGTSPSTKMTNIDTYKVSATFYCYIYEQLGPEAFAQFYNLLTGGELKTSKKGLAKLGEMVDPKADLKYKGNVIACLNELPRDHKWNEEWETSEDFVRSYIEAVNKRS